MCAGRVFSLYLCLDSLHWWASEEPELHRNWSTWVGQGAPGEGEGGPRRVDEGEVCFPEAGLGGTGGSPQRGAGCEPSYPGQSCGLPESRATGRLASRDDQTPCPSPSLLELRKWSVTSPRKAEVQQPNRSPTGGHPHQGHCQNPLELFFFNRLFVLAVPGLSFGMRDLCCSTQDLLLWHMGFLVAACMWDLVPRPGIEPRPLQLGAQSLTHWTTRDPSPELFKIRLFGPQPRPPELFSEVRPLWPGRWYSPHLRRF